MNRNPINSDQAADLSPFRAWVADYRELNQKDKSAFIDLFQMQRFGLNGKQYSRDAFLYWTRKNGTVDPPLEVAKWCGDQLKRIKSEIEALRKKTEINEPTEEVLSA